MKGASSGLTRPAMIGLVLAGLGCAVHLFLLFHFNFTQDDAYISFRYAQNYVNGHGLVYNAGERIEGYTNFLWTIWLIAGRLAGFDLVLFSKILGALFGIATIVTLFRFGGIVTADKSGRENPIASGAACLILGTAYAFAYWTVSGLETAAFTFMLTAAVVAFYRRSFAAAPLLVLATLLRPEGALATVVVLAIDIISRRKITAYAAGMAGLWALYLLPLGAFKLWYYGSLLPNPFYAKTAFGFQQLVYGAQYAGQYFWHYLGAGVFVLPAIIVVGRLSPQLKAAMGFALIYCLYIVIIGGDVVKVDRFFVPLMPVLAIIVVTGIFRLLRNRWLALASVAVVVTWQLLVPWGHTATFHSLERGLTDKMEKIASSLTAVDSTDFSIALSTIGIVGYRLIDHPVIDMLGLTDSVVARHPEPPVEGMETTWREGKFNAASLLSRQPDYILFSTGFKPSAPAERALYLYSAFLDHYRTIAFNFGTPLLHPVYRRVGPITGEIQRDVDVRFVQNFNRGINLMWNAKDYPGALAAFRQALQCSPQPAFPYVYYYMAIAQQNMGDIEASYRSLQETVRLDDRVYEGHKELYRYEYFMGNQDAAQYHRARIAALVPWYLPRLDSLITGMP
jgi:arabinofuranosyltransferase